MKQLLRAFALVALMLVSSSPVGAQGMAITYQGRLDNGTVPADGSYDLRFALFDANSGGSPQGAAMTNTATAVRNGLFTVTLDIGANVFTNGGGRWLEIGARTNGGTTFTTLTPRQPLTAVPYAIQALNGTPGPQGSTGLTGPQGVKGDKGDKGEKGDTGSAGPLGPQGPAGIAGTNGLQGPIGLTGPTGTPGAAGPQGIKGDKGDTGSTGPVGPQGPAGLTGATGPQGIPGSADGWSRTGNAGANPTNGAFLGTTDNQPLEFKVNGRRGLRLEPVASGSLNSVNVIGGWEGNSVGTAFGATIAGGGHSSEPQQATGHFSTVGGGKDNTASGLGSTIAGGLFHTASAVASTVSGGSQNTASGDSSTVPGGRQNSASGATSFAAGLGAGALHDGTFVWGDHTAAPFDSTGINQFLIRASGGVGINKNNPATALDVEGTVTATGFSGNGSGLTGVAAASYSGAIGDSQLSANIPRFDSVNTFTGPFGISSPGGGLLSVVDEVFAPALVMTGGGAPGILRVRNALEIWPNSEGTAAGAIDLRDADGVATIVLHGDDGKITAAGFVGSGGGLTEVAKLAGGNTFTGDTRINGKLSLNSGFFGNTTATIRAGAGETFPFAVLDQNGTTLLQVIENSVVGYELAVSGNAGKTVGGDTWLVVSDERLKQHIRPYEHGLDAILQLRTKRFEYIDDPAHHTTSGHEEIGLIAQQVEGIIPEAVSHGADGYRTLNASPIHWATINAIQELNAKVEAQRRENAELKRDLADSLGRRDAEVTALQTQNATLEARLAALEKLVTSRPLETAANGGGR